MTEGASKDRSALIEDLEALLEMCRNRPPSKEDRAFQWLLIMAIVILLSGFVFVIFFKGLGFTLMLVGTFFGMIALCGMPGPSTLSKEECARVFSRFDALPGKHDLLDRYAKQGTLYCTEVGMQLMDALSALRAEARKAEILELAKGVREIPKEK